VRELGEDCVEGLVVYLLHSGEKGGVETRGKAHRSGKEGGCWGATRTWGVDLR